MKLEDAKELQNIFKYNQNDLNQKSKKGQKGIRALKILNYFTNQYKL